MSITLHYRAEVDSDAARDAAIARAADSARARGWRVDPVEAPEAGTRGIIVRPHPDCEPFHLVFGPQGDAHDTCKTGFAPAAVHRDVVAWMRALSPPVRWRVDDSAGFWDDPDPQRLDAARAEFDVAIARARHDEPELIIGYRLPDGRIADAVLPPAARAPVRFADGVLRVADVTLDLPGWVQVTNPSGPMTLSRVDLGALVQVAHDKASGSARGVAVTARRLGAPAGPLRDVRFGAFAGVVFRRVDATRCIDAWLVEDAATSLLLTLFTTVDASSAAFDLIEGAVLPTLRRTGA